MRLLKGILYSLVLVLGFTAFSQDIDHDKGLYKFLENKNQWPEKVHFRASLTAGNIWLENGGILYQFTNYGEFHHAGLEMEVEEGTKYTEHLVFAEFIGANPTYDIEKKYKTKEYYNFFLGNDPSKWASDVRGFSHLNYVNLYDNIDLKLFEKEGQLKYEYTVKPGGNPSDIKVKYHGQDKIRLNKNGELVIETSLGQIIEQKPFVYQIKNGKIKEIESEFNLNEDLISFFLGEYDVELPLVIDPILIFATYSGSPTDNFGMTGTYAYNGDGYSGGTIYGNQYPIPLGTAWSTLSNFNSLQGPNYGITDVFLSKYSSDGAQMLWTNFVGGGDEINGSETVHSLICDTLNNIYLYGATSSTDFPMQNAYQNTHSGGDPGGNFLQNGVYYTNQGTDIYVTKISSDGMTLLGSTYVGGAGNDGINYNVTSYAQNYQNIGWYDSLTANYGDQFRGEIMLDSAFNVMIASSTRSTDFPVLNSFQGANAGQQDGVLFKLTNDLSSLMWSTYFGGSENDACYSVKIDSSQNIILAGGTCSNDLTNTVGGLYQTYQGGVTDGYVSKITPDGSSITQTTYFGTSTYDQAYFVEIDRWDNIYIYGQTDGNIPIINSPYSNPNSGQFITKLSPDLTAVTYSTLIGNGDGDPDISPSAFLVDVCGNVYISGWGANILQATPLDGMPTTTGSLQPTNGDGFNFYLFVLERDAQSMLYGTYLGGGISAEHVDGGTSRFDKFGIIYQSVCGGCWGNSDFPTSPGAWSSQNLDVLGGANIQSGCNNLLFKFDFELIPVADFQLSSLEGCAPFTLTLDNESNDTINSIWTFPPEATVITGGVNPELLFTDPGTYEIIISITDTICNLIDTAKKVITVYEQLDLDILYVNDTVVCAPFTQDLTADSQGSAISFTWSDDPNFTNVLNAGAMDSVITISPTQTTTYYVTATNGWSDCDLVDSLVVQFVDGGMELTGVDTMCLGDTLILEAHNLIPSVVMNYSWSPNIGLISTGPGDSLASVSPPVSQWYYLTAVTNLGCTIYDSIWIDVAYIDPADVLAVANPDTIPEGGSSVLTAYPSGFQYVWWPQAQLNVPIGQIVTATLNETTTFEVTIGGNGCEAKTQVTVYTQEFICGDVYIFVPSGFSPNNDNENDVLYVRGQNLLEINFKIFDRWGELMFETTDQSLGWDGTFKGEPVDPDVYVYHLTAVCFDGQETLIKGNVTVLK
ncbi:MAG: gliding motility-associated-like protein [Arenicella sp.]|jgi:gliding motility-associated-like protein